MDNNIPKAFEKLDQAIAKLQALEQSHHGVPEAEPCPEQCQAAASATIDLSHLIKSVYGRMGIFARQFVSRAVDGPADEQKRFMVAMETAAALYYKNVYNGPNIELE